MCSYTCIFRGGVRAYSLMLLHAVLIKKLSCTVLCTRLGLLKKIIFTGRTLRNFHYYDDDDDEEEEEED